MRPGRGRPGPREIRARNAQGPRRSFRVLAGKASGIVPGPPCGRLKREDTMNGHRGWSGAVVVAAILMGLGGCATVGYGPVATERILSAAGFQMKLADTPETLTTLQSLPPRTLVPAPRHGQMRYLFPDPPRCGCLYEGTESQYQGDRRIEFEKQLADERLSAAWEDRNAAIGWGAARGRAPG